MLPRTSSLRRSATLLLALVVVLLSFQAPAEAGTPKKVGAPWVKAAGPTSLTLAWPQVSGASGYQVFWSTSYAGVLKKSAPSRKVGRTGEYRVTGLKPGAIYCFQVRALSGKKVGKKSSRHCKLTMRRANDTRLETANVATFNVCSQAGSCYKTWKARVASVTESVRLTDADLIGFQELDGPTGALADVDRALEPLGYARTVYRSSKAIYYRPSRFTVATAPGECETQTYRGSTAGWDQSRPRTAGGRTYTYANGAWSTEVCDEDQPRAGEISLGDNKWAVWTDFVSNTSGKTYRFVDVHLVSGNTASLAAQRDRQTRTMLAGLDQAAAAYPDVPQDRWIIVGDLNSHRNRTNDSPRRVLESRGWFDTYDRSATYATPNFNSANQWKSAPVKSERYGDHVDHVFVKDAVGSTGWRTVHRFAGSRYQTPLPSDHVPVRVTLYLP